MESHGLAGRIQVSEATYERLRGRYRFEARGGIPVKGKGIIDTYILAGRVGSAEDGDDDVDPSRDTPTV